MAAGTEQAPESGLAAAAWEAGQGAFIVDRALRLMAANRQAQALLGPDAQPGDQLRIEELVEGPGVGALLSALDAALGQGEHSAEIEARLVDQGGQGRDCVLEVGPVFGGGRQVVGALVNFRRDDCAALDQDGSDDNLPSLPRLGYQTLFESLAEGIFTINTRWRITSFNHTAEKITGYSRREVLGRHCWDIFRSDLCQTDCPLRTTLETGLTRMDQDVRILDKDGSRLGLLVNTSVVRDAAGVAVGAVETFRPLAALQQASAALGGCSFSDIVGAAPPMRRLFDMLPDVAVSEANVLLQGESGTGKELFARAIHHHSKRRQGPFVAVNCAALAETLLESELFGHEKAAFTGAVASKAGRFELAKGGTIFLDEIGELKPELQVKLLRVLEQRVFERVGGARLIPMEARIISATNLDLTQARREGRFREDLYYRLRTVPLNLPPLRERPEDIPLLVQHFLDKFNRLYGREVRAVDPKVMRIFASHAWPGNVRELERAIEYAFVFVKGPVIFARHLPPLEGDENPDSPAPTPRLQAGDEEAAIRQALAVCQGRRGQAATLLGLSRTSLWRKMRQYGL
ncbi:MAG: sigma 54-interacting transcriptional regulator [Thermodesulfobacteriota bacterium]